MNLCTNTHSHTHIHIITYAALGKSRGAKLQVGGGDGGGGWGLGATKTKTWNENWCLAMGQQWLCGDGGGFQGTMGWRRTLRILLCAFVVGLWSAPQVARMLHIQNQNRIYYARAGVAWCVCECVEQLTSAGSGYISRLPGTFCIGGGSRESSQTCKVQLKENATTKKRETKPDKDIGNDERHLKSAHPTTFTTLSPGSCCSTPPWWWCVACAFVVVRLLVGVFFVVVCVCFFFTCAPRWWLCAETAACVQNLSFPLLQLWFKNFLYFFASFASFVNYFYLQCAAAACNFHTNR